MKRPFQGVRGRTTVIEIDILEAVFGFWKRRIFVLGFSHCFGFLPLAFGTI